MKARVIGITRENSFNGHVWKDTSAEKRCECRAPPR
jgi:hypothetical protein